MKYVISIVCQQKVFTFWLSSSRLLSRLMTSQYPVLTSEYSVAGSLQLINFPLAGSSPTVHH